MSDANQAMNNVKLVVMATSQYCTNQNENTLSQLLRHVEVLLAVLKTTDADWLFNDRNVIGSECISNLLKVVVTYNADLQLICKLFQLLNCIADDVLCCDFINQDFNAVSSLLSYVVQHCCASETVSMLECLHLLEKLTYKHKVHDSTNHLDKFLNYILEKIDDSNSMSSGACLGILNNLVANSMAIQATAKGLMDTSRMRNLMKYLRQDSMANKVSVLSIVTYLCWEEDLAKKLYSMKNVTQTLKLLFSRLSCFDDMVTQHRAADLCVELLKHEEISQQFAIYESEQNCATRLFMLLQREINPHAASKVLEVILSFCHIPQVRHNVCDKILNDADLWQVLLTYGAWPISKNGSAPGLLALSLVRELCEEKLDSTFEFCESSWLSALLPMLFQQLVPTVSEDKPHLSDLLLKASMLKTLKSIQILNCLCNDDELAKCVASEVNISCLSQVIDHQLTHNLTGMTRSTISEWSDVGVDVVLNSLQLVLRLKSFLPELERLLYSTLQDTRLVPFLARSITGTDRSRVQTAMRLHQEALPLPDFPAVLLAEAVAHINERVASHNFPTLNLQTLQSFNTTMHDKSELKRGNPLQPYITNIGRSTSNISINSLPSHTSTASESDDKENILTLIAKMQTSDKAPSSTDFREVGKTSKILEIYEHKIASLVTKENHLQDLLEAKTLALSQADRLINQYRCQRVRSEEDARKLADMLRESESRCEKLVETVRAAELERSSMERELQTVVEENRNLQKVADQYDRMQSAFQDKSYKIEVLERNLKTSRQEYDTLKELHDMIQKHSEKMKQQHNIAAARLEEVEEERMKLLKRISELEISVSDLTQLVEEQDRSAHVVMEEKAACELEIKNLKLYVNKLDEEAKDLKIKVTSQEHSKHQIEHQVKERNAEIKKLNNKIDSMHKTIASMNSERSEMEENVQVKEDEIEHLQQKLDKQAQTLLMITELSNNIRGSQS